MTPKFFKNPKEFRKWLEQNHHKKTELVVGFYKVGTGKPSMIWSDSVDQALCYGWIDGVRTSIDKDSYKIRFTPRKSSSTWSAININKIKDLTDQGLMRPAGLEIFKNRKEERSKIYSHENEEKEFPSGMEKQFKIYKTAWNYFQCLAPSYRKPSINWVVSAKQEITRLKRLAQLIKDSEAGTNQWKDNKYKKK